MKTSIAAALIAFAIGFAPAHAGAASPTSTLVAQARSAVATGTTAECRDRIFYENPDLFGTDPQSFDALSRQMKDSTSFKYYTVRHTLGEYGESSLWLLCRNNHRDLADRSLRALSAQLSAPHDQQPATGDVWAGPGTGYVAVPDEVYGALRNNAELNTNTTATLTETSSFNRILAWFLGLGLGFVTIVLAALLVRATRAIATKDTTIQALKNSVRQLIVDRDSALAAKSSAMTVAEQANRRAEAIAAAAAQAQDMALQPSVMVGTTAHARRPLVTRDYIASLETLVRQLAAALSLRIPLVLKPSVIREQDVPVAKRSVLAKLDAIVNETGIPVGYSRLPAVDGNTQHLKVRFGPRELGALLSGPYGEAFFKTYHQLTLIPEVERDDHEVFEQLFSIEGLIQRAYTFIGATIHTDFVPLSETALTA